MKSLSDRAKDNELMFSFQGVSEKLVLIAMRVHLFPSRTQKLSSFAPTILGGRLPGKIGNANIQPQSKDWGFFAPVTVHRTVTDGATII